MVRTKYWLRGNRREPASEFFPWRRLPVELQFQVLECLVPSYDHRGFVGTRGGGLAVYSTVCRTWQEFFERIIFHRLVISQDDVGRFACLTARHTSLLRDLWLRVEHPRYDCSECSGTWNFTAMGENDTAFMNALSLVFKTLRRWEERLDGRAMANGASKDGLTLEISSHSLSDSEHFCKEISFDAACEGDGFLFGELLLSSTSSRDDMESLLLLAAAAARRLPNLRTLEMWCGRQGHALLFRYSAMDRAVAEISCYGTRELVLRPHIEKSWEGVSEWQLRVAPSRIFDGGLIKSHGDAIHNLGLQLSVVHPQSLRQIRGEQQRPIGNRRFEVGFGGYLGM